VTVDDHEIALAVKWLFDNANIVAEPSGAASVAAVLRDGNSVGDNAVAVISGGNVAPADYARYIQG
jgi:threonine dehydratase